jgi:hypothetical protein
VEPHHAENGEHDQSPDDKEDKVFHIGARQQGLCYQQTTSSHSTELRAILEVTEAQMTAPPDCAERGCRGCGKIGSVQQALSSPAPPSVFLVITYL